MGDIETEKVLSESGHKTLIYCLSFQLLTLPDFFYFLYRQMPINSFLFEFSFCYPMIFLHSQTRFITFQILIGGTSETLPALMCNVHKERFITKMSQHPDISIQNFAISTLLMIENVCIICF